MYNLEPYGPGTVLIDIVTATCLISDNEADQTGFIESIGLGAESVHAPRQTKHKADSNSLGILLSL